MRKRIGLLVLVLAFCFSSLQAQDAVSDLLGRINNLRASLALPPYSLNGALSAAALNQAQWMASTGEVSHTQYDGSRPVDRAQANGYASSWVGENIYMGSIARVDDAWDFWMNSPIHYAGLTSANYQEIGIAAADGDYGHAFVLVFGNPSGRVSQASSGGGNVASNGGNAAAAPQYAILGYDGVGNIRYQLQEGETLGDVLLIFGYTWDDLAALMSLNNFTEADVRDLDVGQEILVPPHEGTWTPSAPNPESSPELTEAVVQANNAVPSPTFDMRDLTPNAEQSPNNNTTSGIIPTPAGSDSFIIASPTTEVEQIAPPEVFVLASPSPSIQSTNLPSTSVSMLVATFAPTSTPLPEDPLPPAAPSGMPLWLIGAVVVQIGVLVYAGFEFLRRMGKA